MPKSLPFYQEALGFQIHRRDGDTVYLGAGKADALCVALTERPNVLCFDLIMMYGPSAAFVSAGGYHHHIGMNTWNSTSAPPPPPESIGLRYFVTLLPNLEALGRVVDRVHAASVEIEETDEGLLVHDPSQNALVLSTEPK